MSVFKRGKYWHIELMHDGERIQLSSKSTKRADAVKMEFEVRSRLVKGETATDVKRPKSSAPKAGDAMHELIQRNRKVWSRNTIKIHENSLKSLEPFFGRLPLHKITHKDIDRYQDERIEKVSGRTVNIEIQLLKMTMGKRMWMLNIVENYKPLPARNDIGRALHDDEMKRLLDACKASVSKGLYPAVLLSIHTGLRSSELRNLKWSQVDFNEPCITVGKSKTPTGTGRVVDLSQSAVTVLKDWQSQFPWWKPEHYIFPVPTYRLSGQGKVELLSYDPTKPQETFKTSWNTAKEAAKIKIRWHDLRHTFVSIIGEHASDATIMALSGHISRKMLERYSHSRNNAKKLAILSAFGGVPEIVPTQN